MKTEAKNAFKISSVCIITYLISYMLRNILSVVTPALLENTTLVKEVIATFSSSYMFTYAIGQLLCGVVGDYVKAKYMTLIGLLLSGIAILSFPFFLGASIVQAICFGLVGFGLSTLRGPIVKTISENNSTDYARISCMFLSAVSFLGPAVASFLAIVLKWNQVFYVAGIITISMGIFAFTSFSILEKKGLIKKVEVVKQDKQKSSIFGVFFIEGFVSFLIVSMVLEVFATSIKFWIPTYITERLALPENVANVCFTILSICSSIGPFISFAVYKLLKNNEMLQIRFAAFAATVMFVLLILVKNPYANVGIFILAQFCISVATGAIWSIYLPSLGKTGKSSSANGILDSFGYFLCALVNLVYMPIVNKFSWEGLIVFWISLLVIVMVVTFTYKKDAVKE